MPATPRASRASVRVQPDGDAITISLHGALDGLAGDALLDSLRTELDRAPQRMTVDLLGVDSWTADGAAALRACEVLATGLQFRTGAGAGHEALLAAYGDAEVVE